MKTYVKPEIEIVNIKSEGMLAASLLDVTNTEHTGTPLSYDIDTPSFDLWAEDEETEW